MNFAYDAQKLGTFDVSGLKAIVEPLTEEMWGADANRQEAFGAHAATHTIKLIADWDFRHKDPTIHPAFHLFEAELAPVFAHIRGYYLQTLRQRRVAEQHGPGYFIRALLTRLPGGASIRPHIDEGESLKRCHRIHLPIVSNPQSVFSVGQTRFHMSEGELWEINNRRVHAVENQGSDARIHLILDYVQPGEVVFDLTGPITA